MKIGLMNPGENSRTKRIDCTSCALVAIRTQRSDVAVSCDATSASSSLRSRLLTAPLVATTTLPLRVGNTPTSGIGTSSTSTRSVGTPIAIASSSATLRNRFESPLASTRRAAHSPYRRIGKTTATSDASAQTTPKTSGARSKACFEGWSQIEQERAAKNTPHGKPARTTATTTHRRPAPLNTRTSSRSRQLVTDSLWSSI